MTVSGLFHDLRMAAMLLTRLPTGPQPADAPPPDLARSVWAYPVIGMVVGGIGGVAFWAAGAVGLPPPVAALAALAVMVLATGAFHEDGLADTADSLGGWDRERKLEIMRDSRIGTYGTVALVLSLGLRAACLTALEEPGPVFAALVVGGGLSRGVIVGLLAALPPARPDGMGVVARNPERRAIAAGLALAVVPAVAVFGPGGGLVLAALAGMGGLVLGWRVHRQIGGYTGDVLGAGQQVAEILILAGAVAMAPT
ncbi:MAG: adenosylcobinamide-GDP ribazoletransferase [Inquilinaceae bacterium]